MSHHECASIVTAVTLWIHGQRNGPKTESIGGMYLLWKTVLRMTFVWATATFSYGPVKYLTNICHINMGFNCVNVAEA